MLRSVLIGFACVGLAGSANAQVSPDHLPATLDGLLVAKDYSKLGDTIKNVARQEDLRSDLDWLKDKMMSGETAFVTMLYSKLLWTASTGLPAAEQHQLKQTAAMATLYAFAAIQIDGARCGDRSAPAHRTQQLLGWSGEVWPFLKALSADEQGTVMKLVPMLEKRTAARRDAQGDVDFLCRAGMEEMSYNLKHGKAREVPPGPGQFGRQVVLFGDGKYKPSERPETEWRAEGQKRRDALPQVLATLVAGASPAKSAK